MSEIALEHLRRHFEKEYGKLPVPKPHRKRKRESEIHLNGETCLNSDEEWHGFDEDPPTISAPEIVSFTDHSNDAQDTIMGSYKSFMVMNLLKLLIIVF
jgi:hypothetical protein